MIFTGSSSVSGQSPLAGALFEMFSDENNNGNTSGASLGSTASPILGALMAAATSVAMDSPSSDSSSDSPVRRLPLTAFAIKHALFAQQNKAESSATVAMLPPSCLLPAPALPLSALSESNLPNTLPMKRSRPDIRSVKRALFVDKSDIDHQANLALVKDQLRTQQQLDNERWNFDFENGRPLVEADCPTRYEWNPLLANASTTCPPVNSSKPATQPETPVKRKLSISDYFTTTKKMKMVSKPTDPKSQSSSESNVSSPDKTSQVDLDVQILRCISPKSSSKTITGSFCSKRQIVRSRSIRRSKRLTTTTTVARSTNQCKKQLNL